MTGIMFARVHARAIRAFARASTFAKSMRGMAAPCLLALALGLAPATSFADDAIPADDSQADSVAGPLAGPGYEGDAQSASPNSDLSSAAEGLTLASALSGTAASIVSADVALDAAEPVVGSFTADGLTYAVNNGEATLISVAGGFTPPASKEFAAGESTNISIPSTVTYDGTTYDITAVGPYAFYLSGATAVELPASVASVDSRALRSSDVASVQVADGNPAYATCDGVLYDVGLTSLLLIPEGRSEGVRIPYTAEEVPAEAFSHAAEVSAIFVDADSPTYSSEDGLLYSADGTTLLRVPAGATEITIRDGCTAIAVGAMEGCAKLERINAPATVASISPDAFESVPTVSLPIVSALQDDSQDEPVAEGLAPSDVDGFAAGEPADSAQAEGAEGAYRSEAPASSQLPSASSSEDSGSAPQLTAMVALSAADDDLPEVDPSSVQVVLPDGADASPWQSAGFSPEFDAEAALIPSASVQSASTFDAYIGTGTFHGNGGTLYLTVQGSGSFTEAYDYTVGCYGNNWALMPEANAFHYYRSDGALMAIAAGYRRGYTATGWSGTYNYNIGYGTGNLEEWVQWRPNTYAISLNAQGSSVSPSSIGATYDQNVTLPAPSERLGYRFLGWNTAADGSGTTYQPGMVRNLTPTNGATVTLYAQWKVCEIGFDTDSEPGDADYPGEPKDPISAPDAVGPDGIIEIEDPKRPGYVFEGWVVPDAATGDKEAVDQDLVYQDESDGKWYVDASKLPDYAGDDGRVELTARWTSVISVDVPSSVTFYADLVTQGQESREGAAEGAFGQNQVSNQSQVDLRVVGLESSAVKTEGSTLGADSILKKADAATPSTSTQKLLSLHPSTKQWKPEELQDPDAVGGDKAATAVDFDLDDVLLEKSFSADDFTIPVGETLNMGYRLNLSETGQQLDYDKLSTLAEGQSASIANVSYTFAADYGPVFWTTDNDGSTLELAAIEADAEAIAAGDAAITAKYAAWMNSDHRFHVKWYDQGATEADDPTKATVYDVRIIGLNHDDRSDGTGKAGITFQLVGVLKDVYMMNYPLCGTAAHYQSGTDAVYGEWDAATDGSGNLIHNTAIGGWGDSLMQARMNPGIETALHQGNIGRDDNKIWNQVPQALQGNIQPVGKACFNNSMAASGVTADLVRSSDSLFLPSYSEVVADASTYAAQGLGASALQALASEGVCYAYYVQAQTKGSGDSPALEKMFPDGSSAVWYLRTCYPPHPWSYSTVNGSLMGYGSAATGIMAISPAFCL